MEFYRIIFGILFFFLIFEINSSRKTKLNIILIWCIFFTLLGGLRWKIGGDWDQYLDHFNFSKWSNIFDYDRYGNGEDVLEPGFVFINVLIKSIFSTFYFYNLITTAFIQYTLYSFCKRYGGNRPLLMYIFYMIVTGSMFHVRAGLAVFVSIWAYKYLINRELKNFLIVVISASLIHAQCIILIPFYWLTKIKVTNKVYLLSFIIFIFFGFIFQRYLIDLAPYLGTSIGSKLQHYTEFETEGAKGANFIGWILNLFFLCVYLYNRQKTKIKPETYNSMLILYLFYNFVILVFTDGMSELVRIISLFFPAHLILFCNSFEFFISQNKLKQLFVILFLISYLFYRYFQIGTGYYFESTCIPYKTIFDYNIL